MADVISKSLACRECGAEITRTRPTGRNPSYCALCRQRVNRDAGRRRARSAYRARPVRLGVCLDCPSLIEGRAQRCGPCGKRRLQDAHNAKRRAERQAQREREGRWFTCIRCDKNFQQGSISGRRQLRCKPCQSVRAAEVRASQRKPPRKITCIDCRSEVQLPLRGASAQKRCAVCAKKAARVIQKRVGHERRALKVGADAEVFTSREIFERDGWKCGICRRRIDKRLKHPHPRSASLDHILPLSRGGGHIRTNVQAAHLTCNLRKYNIGGGEQLLLVG